MTASCCAILASSVQVPVPVPCRNPCKASWRDIYALRWAFMMVVITFQITPTSPMPLYPHRPFGMRITVVQVSYSGMRTSRNSSCVILTNTYYLDVLGSLPHVASHIHNFRCSDRIPNVPPILTVWRPCTTTVIYYLLDRSSGIETGLTRNGTAPPSGVHLIYRSSCSEVMFKALPCGRWRAHSGVTVPLLKGPTRLLCMIL